MRRFPARVASTSMARRSQAAFRRGRSCRAIRSRPVPHRRSSRFRTAHNWIWSPGPRSRLRSRTDWSESRSMREDATNGIEITTLITGCAGMNRHPRARIDATEITIATTAAAQASDRHRARCSTAWSPRSRCASAALGRSSKECRWYCSKEGDGGQRTCTKCEFRKRMSWRRPGERREEFGRSSLRYSGAIRLHQHHQGSEIAIPCDCDASSVRDTMALSQLS